MAVVDNTRAAIFKASINANRIACDLSRLVLVSEMRHVKNYVDLLVKDGLRNCG